MIRGIIATLIIVAFASPAMAAPCEPRPPLCSAKKDRSTTAEQRKTPRQEACTKRYALM